MSSTPRPNTTDVRLKRALTLWDLVLYGVIVLQPTAPMAVFGVINARGQGHVVTTILIALIAMLFTAIAYGRMARAYPSAGSAFTYVGQEINPALGYITGWSMVMDYMLNPLICIIWCSKAAMNFAPGVPYAIWAIFFFLMFTGLNLRGVKTSARINAGLATGMGLVVAIFFVTAARYVFGHPHDGVAFFTRPLYDPATFNLGAVLGGTSIAVLTYIGFDGISTLSEEVENPRRNILLATVLVCVITGVLSSLEVYAAQLVWGSKPFPQELVESAFPLVARQIGGFFLFHLLNFTVLIANVGSGMGSQFAAARLLYGMGRSDALPKRFFGKIQAKRQIPANNVILIGSVALIGAFLITYERGAELLNFGAFIAFMGVNAASFVRYFVRADEKKIGNLLVPVLGFVICAFIWWNLSPPAKIAGTIWLGVGIAYGAWKTSWFRTQMSFDVPEE